MLSKKNRINKKTFPILLRRAGNFYSDNMQIRMIRDSSKNKAFAFVVSLKVSKSAVKRNKIKRIARAITHSILECAADGILVAVFFKPTIINKKYAEIKNEMITLYKKAKII